MTIETKEFGEINIDESDIICFKHPIYGFEKLNKYIILTDDEIGSEIMWLQSIEDPSVCFVVFNMNETDRDYKPKINEEITKMLELKNEDDLTFCAIAVIKEDYKETTINLRSPIIINASNKFGAQVILDDDYPIRHKIFA